eukprot:jgi/Mesen1/1471/ME000132S00413
MAAEVAVAVAEVAEVAWSRYEKRKEHVGKYAKCEKEALEAEEALHQEQAENKRLRDLLEEYKRDLESLQKRTDGVEWLGRELNTAGGTSNVLGFLERKVQSPEFLEQLKSPTSHHEEGPAEGLSKTQVCTKGEVEAEIDVDDPDWWLVPDAKTRGVEQKEECEELDGDSYVLVDKEDVIDGIASFVARYLAYHPQTKGMTPVQLQQTLGYALSELRLKGTVRRFWDWGKFLYTVGCWSATFVSIYKNPLLVRAAMIAIWTSCRVILQLFK